MRILYVTACLPCGAAEAFIVDELTQLAIKNDVLIIPRSPGRPGPHGMNLLPYTRREGLLSLRVLLTAIKVFVKQPISVLRACRPLTKCRSPRVFVRNVAVVPKALWLADVATNWCADHIHCHWAGTTATMALVAARISGISWSLTAHRSDIVANNLLREKALSASMVRAISESGKNMLMRLGVPECSIRVIPMGVRIPKTVAYFSAGTPVVLCPADLLEVKGHKFLIRAWRLLHDRGVQGELWLAGSGHLEPQLQKLASELKVARTISFLGTLPHTLLLEHYANNRISCVVLASVDLGAGCHEGIPVCLLEAMSYGIPVVATRTGGIPELVEPHTGFLVPPGDPFALADAIGQLLKDPHLARRLGLGAHSHVAHTRNVISVAATLESHFLQASSSTLRFCA